MGAPRFLHGLLMRALAIKTTKQAKHQGYGRHSEEEIEVITMQDLKAFSDFLGDKTYFFGNEQPSKIDADLFGFMAVVSC